MKRRYLPPRLGKVNFLTLARPHIEKRKNLRTNRWACVKTLRRQTCYSFRGWAFFLLRLWGLDLRKFSERDRDSDLFSLSLSLFEEKKQRTFANLRKETEIAIYFRCLCLFLKKKRKTNAYLLTFFSLFKALRLRFVLSMLVKK